jgi:hypothetical protein
MPNAEWLGSVGWDGYEWAEDDKPNPIRGAKTEEEFRAAVENVLSIREDSTRPDMGWPWPWDTSEVTDYTYYFFEDAVRWDNRDDWPDMSKKKNVTYGHRSGLIVIG